MRIQALLVAGALALAAMQAGATSHAAHAVAAKGKDTQASANGYTEPPHCPTKWLCRPY